MSPSVYTFLKASADLSPPLYLPGAEVLARKLASKEAAQALPSRRSFRFLSSLLAPLEIIEMSPFLPYRTYPSAGSDR